MANDDNRDSVTSSDGRKLIVGGPNPNGANKKAAPMMISRYLGWILIGAIAVLVAVPLRG